MLERTVTTKFARKLLLKIPKYIFLFIGILSWWFITKGISNLIKYIKLT